MKLIKDTNSIRELGYFSKIKAIDLSPTKTYIVHEGKVYEVAQENILDNILEMLENHRDCGCFPEVKS